MLERQDSLHRLLLTQLGRSHGSIRLRFHVLGVLGVVVLPITSGDTAFRVGRLMLADYLHVAQERLFNRYILAVERMDAEILGRIHFRGGLAICAALFHLPPAGFKMDSPA